MEQTANPSTSVVEWFWSAPPEALFTQKDLAAVTALSHSFFERARWTGTGPKFVKLGGGHLVRYVKRDALNWLNESAPVVSTSERPQPAIGAPREPRAKQKARAKAKSTRRVASKGRRSQQVEA